MPINVYAWPPVAITGRSWQVVQPVARIRSGLTGKEQVQSSQRARRMVSIEAIALGPKDKNGGGYMEMLGVLLAGGEHAVRLSSWSPNWHLDRPKTFQWLSQPLTATATTSAGFAAWQVSGLPPLFPLVRPGDRFTVAGVVYQAINAATASASGVAVVRVLGTTEGSGALVLSSQETAVFRPESIPTGAQRPGQNWSYAWSFREVFVDEVGGFTEVNPWS